MSDDTRKEIERLEMGVVGAQFSPKLVYLGVAMVVLLLANTFLAFHKNKLQAEIDRQAQVIVELRQTLSSFQRISDSEEFSSSDE